MGQDAAITLCRINTIFFSTSKMHSKTSIEIVLSPFVMLEINFKTSIFGPLPETEYYLMVKNHK